MANFLRKDKRQELQADRALRKEERIKRRGCPQCHSKSVEKVTGGWQCRNCHRVF